MAGFEGMWRRPLSDYEKGVKEYLVTLDTNVLLNLYRFTPQARNELLSVLRTLQERLWVSHQVAKEYYSRRMTAVNEHITLYTSVPKALNDSKTKAIQELNTFAKRRSMSPEDRRKLVDPLTKAFESVIADIRGHGEAFDLSLAKVATNDPILEALAEILDEKTGLPFEEEEATKLLEEYTRRASNEIPPGYRDVRKSDNPHGDYFLWEQVLREATKRKRPVLLVTNDAKDDWVQLEAGITIGPRPELMNEFKDRCGLDFLLTDLGTFLKVAKSELGAAISESTVAQAENIEPGTPRGEERIRIPLEEYDETVSQLLVSRGHFASMANDPKLNNSSVALAESLRDKLEEVLSRKTPAMRKTSDAGSVYLRPTDWEALQEAKKIGERVRIERRNASGSKKDFNLLRRSHNIQERLQQAHWERNELIRELREVQEEITLEGSGENRGDLDDLLAAHDSLSERIAGLQRTESELSEQLHHVQLRLRTTEA
ncbi:PIN domain-containing protein [Streptomyces atratus]|uniref:PIN domain-containing protein n=1 Tax=Streptomyces atratus TaxID=1893 RepID=UPI002AC310BC|nr:PIN domain-containing protein [Streptomyces atratus]WPW30718.1 PIN domain-containing protein [Streptomyces atratus]